MLAFERGVNLHGHTGGMSTKDASAVSSLPDLESIQDEGLRARLQSLGETLAAKDAAKEAAKVYQLALWNDDQRAMPAHFLACALFAGVLNKHATDHLKSAEVLNANGLSITYTGQRLTQVHADVWQGIMHRARAQPEGAKVRFRAREFLRTIGRHDGQSQRKQLHGWITDLCATCVEIRDHRSNRLYFGSLLPDGAADESNPNEAAYAVSINRELCKLFDAGFATFDWQQRRNLMGKPLALWLQHYFSSFKKPVSVADLQVLSGSKATERRKFRSHLKQALKDVAAAGGHRAYIDAATDVVRPIPEGQKALPAPAAAQGTLELLPPPEMPMPSAKARATFEKLYPGKDCDACIRDWHHWLTKQKKTANKPDAAFLGFAKKWVAGQGA